MKNRLITLILVSLITVFAIHVLYVNTGSLRFDFTSDQRYTLSEGTREILAKMNKEAVKPIDVKLYFSATAGKTLPKFIKNFVTYKDYVSNLLDEYERAGNGKIRVRLIDPKPDSDDAQDAADFGLEGKPINQEGDQFFFGIVFQTQTGSKDQIAFLSPDKQETIEYEISKKIYSLIWPKKKRIGLLSGIEPLGEQDPSMARLLAAQGQQPGEPWLALQVLKEEYEVNPIPPDTDRIDPASYDLLLVVHPKGFSDKQLWAIDEWVITGGRTIVFLDPYCIADQPPQNPQNPWAAMQYKPASSLPKLLEAWGIDYKDNRFAADYELALKRMVTRGGPEMKVLIDLAIDEQNRDLAFAAKDNPIFTGLANLRFFTPGVLESSAKPGVTATALLQTTLDSCALEVEPGFGDGAKLSYLDFQDPSKLEDRFTSGGKPLALAYLLRGKFASAFPNGAKFPEKAPQPPPGLPPGFQMPVDPNAPMVEKAAITADKLAESSVLVFADADFMTDQLAFERSIFGAQPQNDNYKLLLNSVDFLLGSSELMKVRAKQPIRRPFKVLDEIEARADKQMLERERKIRADIQNFERELREKSSSGEQGGNAVLLRKKLQDEIKGLNDQISKANRDLRDIRKIKRAQVETTQSLLSAAIVWLMPVLLCSAGLFTFVRNRARRDRARKG